MDTTGASLSARPKGLPGVLRYVRATVAYDGTDFAGFQWQTNGRTVQGALEEAIKSVTQHECRVVGSGRTDAGVHAIGQVVGFTVSWRHSLSDLHRALNAVLPFDIVITELQAANEGWHPRFSATRRTYRYTILNQAVRSPLDRRYAYLVTQPLAPERLQTAADRLVGELDFASFGRPMQPGQTTVRRILAAEWNVSGPRFTFDVAGNAFLRGMVRTLVGNLLQVGLGLWTVDELAEVLAARERSRAATPAPACGLCLLKVEYD
jgi:tRNA pseudouridine38-40 synthase